MKLFGLPDGMAHHRRGWQSSSFRPESLPIFPAMPSLLMLPLGIRPCLVVLETFERSRIVVISEASMRQNMSAWGHVSCGFTSHEGSLCGGTCRIGLRQDDLCTLSVGMLEWHTENHAAEADDLHQFLL